jgi:hypothetical protein
MYFRSLATFLYNPDFVNRLVVAEILRGVRDNEDIMPGYEDVQQQFWNGFF